MPNNETLTPEAEPDRLLDVRAALKRVEAAVVLPQGTINLLAHFESEFDEPYVKNVIADLRGGRADRWIAEAYALDAVENSRLFRVIRRLNRGIWHVYVVGEGMLLKARETHVDHDGDPVWIATDEIDNTSQPGSDSNDALDGVWCCWVPIGVI